MTTSPKKLAANRRNALKSTGPRTPAGKARASRNGARHGLYAVDPALPGLERRETWEAHREGVRRSLAPEGYLEEVLAERVAFLLWRLRRVARYEREAVLSSWAEARRYGGTLRDPDDYRVERLDAERVLRVLEVLDSIPADGHVCHEDAVAVHWEVHRTASALGSPEKVDEVQIPGVPLEDADFDAFDGWTAGLLRTVFEVYAAAIGSAPAALLLATGRRAWSNRAVATEKEKEAREERERAKTDRLLLKGDLVDKVTKYETTVERSLFRTLHELQRLQAARSGGPALAPVAVDVDVETDAGGLTLEAEVIPAEPPE